MKKLIATVTVVVALAGVSAGAAQACTIGSSYEQYVSCGNGALLVTYTCVDGHVWRGTGWRVLWGCG